MPVLDGYEATRIIRANPIWQELPILAMTANVIKADVNRTADAGMNDHIAKPADVVELFSMLANWVTPAAPAAQGAAAELQVHAGDGVVAP